MSGEAGCLPARQPVAGLRSIGGDSEHVHDLREHLVDTGEREPTKPTPTIVARYVRVRRPPVGRLRDPIDHVVVRDREAAPDGRIEVSVPAPCSACFGDGFWVDKDQGSSSDNIARRASSTVRPRTEPSRSSRERRSRISANRPSSARSSSSALASNSSAIRTRSSTLSLRASARTLAVAGVGISVDYRVGRGSRRSGFRREPRRLTRRMGRFAQSARSHGGGGNPPCRRPPTPGCGALPTLCPRPPDHGGDGRITRDTKLLNVQQALDVVSVPVDFDSRRLHHTFKSDLEPLGPMPIVIF